MCPGFTGTLDLFVLNVEGIVVCLNFGGEVCFLGRIGRFSVLGIFQSFLQLCNLCRLSFVQIVQRTALCSECGHAVGVGLILAFSEFKRRLQALDFAIDPDH